MSNTAKYIELVGIYKITSPSNKIYIGQSVNIIQRQQDYKDHRCKGQRKLYHSILKYGWEQHIFEIIEECELTHLDEAETWWKHYYGIQCVENGLNCFYTDGKGGYKSEETKKRMSESSKGKTLGFKFTIESKLKMSINGKGKNLGRKYKPEHCLKISEAKKGCTFSEETNAKRRKPKPEGFGKNLSNKVIYNFYNKKTNEFFNGTVYELYTKYNLSSSDTRNMVKGIIPSTKGWLLNNINNNINV